MTHTDKLARDDALIEALRVSDAAIGEEPPSPQALRIIAAIKRLRDEQPVKVASLDRRDYVAEVQGVARGKWASSYGGHIGPAFDAVAGIDTPLGRLKLITWRKPTSGKRGSRIMWAGEYYLNEEPITVIEMKNAGLAQRPTTRNRQRKDAR